MSFKEQLIQKLSPNQTFVKVFAKDSDNTVVDLLEDNLPKRYLLEKKDIKTFFSKPPVLSLPVGSTANDLYNAFSERFGLGLVKGVDYDDGSLLALYRDFQYVTLTMSFDSLGYKGSIGVLVNDIQFTLQGKLERNLNGADQHYLFSNGRVRAYLCSKVFTSTVNLFSSNKLSRQFVSELQAQIKEALDIDFRYELEAGMAIGRFNDGLSDLILFRTSSGYEYFLRFSSSVGDLPVLDYFSKSDSILLDDGSKELLSGMEVISAEKPGEKSGEEFIYSDYEVIKHNPSLSPEENTPQEKELEIESEEITLE